MSGWAMAEFLRSKRIERFTLKPLLLEQAEGSRINARYLDALAHGRVGSRR
jgi:hypothetical protein